MNKTDTIAVIRSLLSSTNQSYSIYNLNRDFKKETGVDIPRFGYGTIGDFLNSIPDTVKVTGIYPIQKVSLVANDKSGHIVSLVKRQKSNGPKNKISSPKKSYYKNIQNTSFRTEEVKKSQIEQSNEPKKQVFKDLKDKDCTNNCNANITMKNSSWSNETIPIINVKAHTKVGQYIEVCPCWIIRPNKFYFRFRKFSKKFHDFEKKLQTFYTKNEKIPYIPFDEVQTKQSCVVFYKISSKEMWHRGEIEEINNSQVVVKLVDYGNTAEISKENLKYLHKDFLSFPQQAILGFLANIKPLNNQLKWPNGSIKKFYDLAFEKDLIGGVVDINDKNNCLGLALSYTGSFEIHINDTLVKEGYAEFDINIPECDVRKVPKENVYEEDEDVDVYEEDVEADIRDEVRSPVYFFTSDYYNNTRLRKMFSAA